MDIRAAENWIRSAWISTIGISGVSLMTALGLAMGPKVTNSGMAWDWILFEVGGAWMLAYGIFRKSRIAALWMLVSFFFFQATLLADPSTEYLRMYGVVGGSILCWIFVKGVRGTFFYHDYHRAQREGKNELQEPGASSPKIPT